MSESDIAIHVENLAKRYRLGSDAPYHLLTESLTHLARKPFRLARRLAATQASPSRPHAPRNPRPDLWALNDVSFEVKRGEVLGIIGRNGAGKSTLLKILSRITEPTAGRATLRGRVGSLLEVGTGFHPELTGRENIYLNGAVLGMNRSEVRAKFDEIVAFAELERFLDTPVKRYSSGMITRLGFAVAAHLEPEILIVDEVLAVGDAGFQKKCLGKMDDVAKEGRTVLFVSHNMAMVLSLCTRCISLAEGRIVSNAPPIDVVDDYLLDISESSTGDLESRTDRTGSQAVRFTHLNVGQPTEDTVSLRPAEPGKPFMALLTYRTKDGHPASNLRVALRFCDSHGRLLFTCSTAFAGRVFERLPAEGCLKCEVPRLPLAPDVYRVHIWSATGADHADVIENAIEFEVVSSDCYGVGRTPIPAKHGPVILDHQWALIN